MKTVCIYHSIDLDGWMSAAIVKHWFKTHNNNYIKDTEDNFCDFIGYNYGQPIPDLSEYDNVIMCDISFPETEMYKLCITKDFIWNDHHASALAVYENIRQSLPSDIYYAKGLRGIQYAACELTWKYFFPNEPMPEIVRLLGRYDCFGHKGTNEETKVLEFQYGARQYISNYEEAYNWLIGNITARADKEKITGQLEYNDFCQIEHLEPIFDAGKAIYQYLCTDAKQSYKNGFIVYLNEVIYDDDGKPNAKQLQIFICINKERFNPINFGIDYHKEGYDGCACFHRTKGGKWAFSLYNDNGLVDCSQIAKQFGGGGHKGAAGMILNTSDFLKLING